MFQFSVSNELLSRKFFQIVSRNIKNSLKQRQFLISENDLIERLATVTKKYFLFLMNCQTYTINLIFCQEKNFLRVLKKFCKKKSAVQADKKIFLFIFDDFSCNFFNHCIKISVVRTCKQPHQT